MSANVTSQPARLTPPNSQLIARRISPEDRNRRNDIKEVAKEETATPARIKFVMGVVCPMRARKYTRVTASKAPAKAASGVASKPRNEYGQSMLMARTAPKPAPAAMPIRYGSANGLRNKPWYAAPLPPNEAPTKAIKIVRGRRISQRIVFANSAPRPTRAFHKSHGEMDTEPIARLNSRAMNRKTKEIRKARIKYVEAETIPCLYSILLEKFRMQ